MFKKKSTDESSSKSTNKANKKVEKQSSFGILGIALLLVIVSIAYSSAVILLGTDGLTPKIMLAPQILFGVLVLGIAFYKLSK
jgi:hypothetical protein